MLGEIRRPDGPDLEACMTAPPGTRMAGLDPRVEVDRLQEE